jgi:hypothetical protein
MSERNVRCVASGMQSFTARLRAALADTLGDQSTLCLRLVRWLRKND